MSLFHKEEETGSPAAFNEKESVVAMLFLVVTADGAIAPEEEELVIAASNRMKLLRGLAIPEFNAVVYKVRDAIETNGREAVLAASVAGIPAGLQETVYVLGADIAFADGTSSPQESSFLRQIQEALQISDELATKTLEVMRIKNRG